MELSISSSLLITAFPVSTLNFIPDSTLGLAVKL
jgi:hypothetical protein